MGCYVEKKLNGERALPQVLGLTASLGAGGEKILERAVKYVLQVRDCPSYNRIGCGFLPPPHPHHLHPPQICANLDSDIVSTKNYLPELEERVPKPVKTFDIVDERSKVRTCACINH